MLAYVRDMYQLSVIFDWPSYLLKKAKNVLGEKIIIFLFCVFKVLQCIKECQVIFFSEDRFYLTNSVDADEMSHYAAFHVSLYCKLSVLGFTVYKGLMMIFKFGIEVRNTFRFYLIHVSSEPNLFHFILSVALIMQNSRSRQSSALQFMWSKQFLLLLNSQYR